MTVGWKTGLIKRKMLQYLKVVTTMLLSHGNTDTLLASMVVARADLPLGKDMSPTEERRKEKWEKFTKYIVINKQIGLTNLSATMQTFAMTRFL